MKRVNIYLSEPDMKKLKEIAKEKDISFSEYIRNLISSCIKEYENKK